MAAENKVKAAEKPPKQKKIRKGGRKITAQDVDKHLRFIIFLALVGLFYIWNSHYAERQIRKQASLTKEIKELKSEYTTLDASLSDSTKMSVIAEIVDTFGLHPLEHPPYKLVKDK